MSLRSASPLRNYLKRKQISTKLKEKCNKTKSNFRILDLQHWSLYSVILFYTTEKNMICASLVCSSFVSLLFFLLFFVNIEGIITQGYLELWPWESSSAPRKDAMIDSIPVLTKKEAGRRTRTLPSSGLGCDITGILNSFLQRRLAHGCRIRLVSLRSLFSTTHL